MKERKKLKIDGIDREILRVLLKKRPLVSRQIAKCVGLTPSAISLRLKNLSNLGLLKVSGQEKIRSFVRYYGDFSIKINCARAVYWDLDLMEEKP